MSLLKADTIKPVTSSGDLSLQGDSGGSAVDCLNITSAGDINFTGNTDAKIKLPSAGGIYESDGSTAILTESGAAVTLDNVSLGSSVGLKLSRNEGLIVKYVSATTVDIDADFLTLYDSSNFGYIASTVNLTANITASGVNGLDTGSEAAIWYHIYVIYNGTTVASLLSASATSPTMPSGYTYKKYVGAVYNPSSSFRDFHQVGNDAVIDDITVLSEGTSGTFASVDVSTFIPSLATRVKGTFLSVHEGGATAGGFLASESGGMGQQMFYSSAVGSSNNTARWGYSLDLIEVQTLYYKDLGTNSSVEISGYSFSNII